MISDPLSDTSRDSFFFLKRKNEYMKWGSVSCSSLNNVCVDIIVHTRACVEDKDLHGNIMQ